MGADRGAIDGAIRFLAIVSANDGNARSYDARTPKWIVGPVSAGT
jgi:hypothetical protein